MQLGVILEELDCHLWVVVREGASIWLFLGVGHSLPAGLFSLPEGSLFLPEG